MKDVRTRPSLSTLENENTQLKEELTLVRIKNDSLRDENMSIKARFQELYKSKAGCNSSVCNGATVPMKPKAIASVLYAMTPKYVPPQKRINRETNFSLPRKETVNVIDLSNVLVNLPTGIKFVPYASKSKSKSDKKIHKNLPAISDTCPLTRITKPEVVSLKNSGSVRTSEPTNNVTVTPRFSEKTLTSYKRKDRNTKDTSTGSPSNIETMTAKYHVIVYPLPV
nr:hypothetical protein [Tanacetum cinerariifolium]